MNITKYNSIDSDTIITLFTKVFSDSEGKSEGLLIGTLVSELMNTTAEDDLYGFVIKDNKKIVGCIFFSRLTFEKNNINAFILSPVAIHTDYQKQGFGQKLINYGVNYLKEVGIEIIFTYGDPEFYKKVGFKTISENTIKAPFKLTYPFGWLCQSLIHNEVKSIEGKSYCVPALNESQYW